jgi:hypothetical protein
MNYSDKRILTIEEYAHQKKMRFVYKHNCLECNYFKRTLLMCVWDEKLQFIGQLAECPAK